MIKKEIMLDGKVLEQRLAILKNLDGLVANCNIENEIREVEKLLIDKHKFAEEAANSHIYLDVCLDGVYYPAVALGNYGYAVLGKNKGPFFEYTNRRSRQVKNGLEVANIKRSIFSCYNNWEKLLVEHITTPTLQEVVGKEYELDFDMFTKSNLWSQLSILRSTEAEKMNSEQFLLFTQYDVFQFLRLFPSKPDTSIPIELALQKKILNLWLYYIRKTEE